MQDVCLRACAAAQVVVHSIQAPAPAPAVSQAVADLRQSTILDERGAWYDTTVDVMQEQAVNPMHMQ